MKIPVSWKLYRFDEIADIVNGQVDPKETKYQGVYQISSENIESGTGKIVEKITVGEKQIISGNYLFDENMIVYSKIRPNLNKVCAPNFKGLCSADIYPILPKTKIVSKKFLFQIMLSEFFLKQAIEASMRTGIPKINRDDLGMINIIVPIDIRMQDHITDILMAFDSVIEKTEQLTQLKEKYKKGLMQSFFEKSNIKGCIKVLMSDVLSLVKREHDGKDILPILSVTTEKIMLQSDYFNKRIANKNTSGYLIVKKDEIAMSGLNFWMGSIHKQNLVDAGIISPAYKVFSINESKADKEYFSYFIKTDKMKRILISSSVQGASIVRRNFDLESFMSYHIKLHNLQEQKEIGVLLSTMDKEIELIKQRVMLLKLQKKGLMQQLLTGKIRAKADEEKKNAK